MTGLMTPSPTSFTPINASVSFRVYTDGACSGNPGPGGWAAVITVGDTVCGEIGGFEPQTTNNRMEIRAAIEALRILQKLPQGSIQILTDSKYLLGGAESWIKNWKRKGWKTAQGSSVLNRDLWESLDALMSSFEKRLSWSYIPGHSGLFGNTRADEIAVAFSKGKALTLEEFHLNLNGAKASFLS